MVVGGGREGWRPERDVQGEVEDGKVGYDGLALLLDTYMYLRSYQPIGSTSVSVSSNTAKDNTSSRTATPATVPPTNL